MKTSKGKGVPSASSSKLNDNDLNDQNSVTLSGFEILEFYRGLHDPNFDKSNWLLLRAKRCAGPAKASHLNDAELQAVAWYAFLHERRDASLSEKTRGDLIKEICKPSNFYHWEFLNLWLREPDVAIRWLFSTRQVDKFLAQGMPGQFQEKWIGRIG